MDEFQFIESLDALLANEDMDETTTAAVELSNTSITPVPGQGMLAAPMGRIGGTNSSSTNWFTGNDTSGSRSDVFAMPLHSNQGYAESTTSSMGDTASYSQYTSAYMDQPQAQKPLLPSGSPAAPITSTLHRTNVTSVASASVCSANSRGSSNASSSRWKGGSKSNNSTTSADTKTTKSGARKRARGGSVSMAISDSEDDCSRRRHDRNLREQRRSQKITNQIDQLREVLASASIRFKPDKYSTLVSVVDYVKRLQRRSTMLDMEHKKLLDTITKTNEIANEPYVGNSGASATSAAGSAGIDATKPDAALSNGVGGNNNGNGAVASGASDIYNDDELVFVRNVDYKCIFERCGMPLAVASIDGRLLDCNEEFVKLTGYRREELLPNEQYQIQLRQQELQPQGSSVVADETFVPNSIFPDVPTSSSSNAMVNKSDGAASHSKSAEIRNFSLFNMLSRDNMEEVFVSLSEMLKQPPQEEHGTNPAANADYWSGNVRLSRNTHIEVGECSFDFSILRGVFLLVILSSKNLTYDTFRLYFTSLPFLFLFSTDANKRVASEKSRRPSQVF
mmetsp:Transcript_4597/g.11063  ORF Transcript_4597/g.11063 Transcript_4597/m.11063 type:complete len:565 (-) Transcript_4597:365-2059(-)